MDINISQNLFVDPALRHFSLNSGGRPIFVSENFPYSDNGILEWNSRYSLNEEIFNSKNCLELRALIISSKFNSDILIYDSAIQPRNVKLIKNCDLTIIDLFELRN